MHGSIVASQIVGVYPVYVLFDDEPHLGALYANDNYEDGPSVVNDGVMPARYAALDNVYLGEESHLEYLSSLSFSPDCEDHKLIPPVTEKCTQAQRVTFPILRGKTIAGLIASGVLSGTMSNDSSEGWEHDEL